MENKIDEDGVYQEDGNDSDLEGRLYAEIYYSNEVHDPGKNFDDGIKTIQDIKNASLSSISSEKDDSPRIDQTDQTDLVNAEKDQVSSHVDVNFHIDKNLNLQKELNVETEPNNILRKESNEVVDENMNPQEKSDRNLTPKQKTPRQKKNKTPKVNNKETENSSTPKSMKRTFEIDKDSGGSNKRRSLERGNSFLNNTPPVSLNARNFYGENASSFTITPGALALLFPSESKGYQRKESKNKNTGFMKRIKEAKRKAAEEKNSKIPAEVDLSSNSKQSKKTKKSTQKDEIIDIISSEDFSDEEQTPEVKKQNQSEKSGNEMSKCLEVDSDSGESILEVPVPPKPPPPVINLNDSGNDSSDGDDSSSDGIYAVNSNYETESKKKDIALSNSNSKSDSDSDSEVKSKDSSKVSKEIPKVISIDNSIENSVEVFEQDSRSRLSSELSNPTETSNSSYSDFPAGETLDSIGENLILNCTAVEKGANSLEEIQKMSNDAISEEIEGTENPTEFIEYFEPLKDLAGPSTSKASGSLVKKSSKKKDEQNYKTSKEKTDEEYFFEPMSVKMKEFYNNSWGGEQFTVEGAYKQMRKDRRFWAILDEDWKPALLKQQRYFLKKNKCTLCRQAGHLRANCPEPKKGPVCHMCGAQGHYETRCPQKICLTCGSKQNSFRQTCEMCRKFFCKLCQSRGHNEYCCPDHWRQFHHTTSETEYRPTRNASKVMKPSRLLYCCNCTMQGHESSTCNKYRWTQHYPTPSQVTNYYNCNQLMSHTNFRNTEDIANLTESPGNAIPDVYLENISDEEELQVSESNDPTINSNFETNQGEILFQANCNKSERNAEKTCNTKDQIVLSDVEGAKLGGLLAKTIVPKALKLMSRILHCDICVMCLRGNKVVMNVIYYRNFTKTDLFKKWISYWAKLSDEDKIITKNLNVSKDRKTLKTTLDQAINEITQISGNIDILWKDVESLTTKLKKNKCKGKRPTKKIVIHNYKQERKKKILKLVKLLYKNDCGMEKQVVSHFQKLREILKEKKAVSVDTYFSIIYYYYLIFGSQVPPNLKEMIQNYFALNKDSTNGSLNNSISSKNSEFDVERGSSENFEDKEYNHQDHLEPESVYQRLDYEEPVPRNYCQNESPSISSHSQENHYDPPPQFYQEQSTSSPGCSNNVQIQNQRSNQFEFPVGDFIPISNYRPSEFLEEDPLFSQPKNSKQFRRNPMHNFRTFDPRAPQTNQRLNQEASHLMKKARQLKLPHLKRAGDHLRDLINQNRLQRKHINHFRHLINSENKKGFR